MLNKILVFLLLTTTASAEMWVCYDESTSQITKTVSGDCMTLGLCSGFNNTGLKSNCFEATKAQYEKARERFVKYDRGDVIDMTQGEKDAILEAEADAQAQAVQDAIDKFNVTNLELMTALIQRINARIPNNPITKAEIIQQLKDNRQ